MTRTMIIVKLLVLVSAVAAAQPVKGPVEAVITRVIDGDTFDAVAAIWPGIAANARIRIDNIDAPELRGKCKRERRLARRAKAFVERFNGATVGLTNIRPGRYGGRTLARVTLADGSDLGRALVARGLARPWLKKYDKAKIKRWCP